MSAECNTHTKCVCFRCGNDGVTFCSTNCISNRFSNYCVDTANVNCTTCFRKTAIKCKTCDFISCHTNNKFRVICRLNIPFCLDGGSRNHVVEFLELSLGHHTKIFNTRLVKCTNCCLFNFTVNNDNVGLVSIVYSCCNLTVDNNGCCEFNVHLNCVVFFIVCRRTVICTVNSNTECEVLICFECNTLLVVASLNYCCLEINDIDCATCVKKCIVCRNIVCA